MPKDHLVTKGNHLSSFFGDNCLELLLLCFGTGGGFSFFCLDLLGVHLVVNFEGGSWKNLKERFTIVGDVDDIGGTREEGVVFVIDLKVEVLIGVSSLWGKYDLLVRNVLAFS